MTKLWPRRIGAISLLCLLAGCGPAPHRSRASEVSRDAAVATPGRFQPKETVLQMQGVAVTSLTYDSRVFFDSDQDRPRSEAGPVLDALATRLRQDALASHVAVLGHTDAIGSDAYNLDLSRRRALGVVHALEARGIQASRLQAVAIGKRQPVAPDTDEAGRARNRRVEFLISPSARAIAAVIRTRPAASVLRAQNPAALSLHVRQPEALTRAPLGAPVTY